MPIYEYGCQKCGKRTEAIQRIGERRLKICPHCAGPLKKLASAPAIQFKGSGWYVTDYARAKKEEKAGSSDKGETAEKAGSSEKGEATEKGEKPVEKAEKTAEKSEKKKESKEKKAGKE